MVPDAPIQIPKLRCSPFHSSLDVDPIGTAASYDAYLCVEVPLPWPRDISMAEPFSSLCDPPAASMVGADGRRWRPQGLVPPTTPGGTAPVATGDTPDASVRVTTWEQARPGGVTDGRADLYVGPLRRCDWSVDPSQLVDLLSAILSADGERLERFAGLLVAEADMALYVCSHGQRDICCGSLGMELYGGLEDLGDTWTGEVRRCSHTGGHRFAATGITFPDAYAWAHLTPRVADAVVNRRVEPRQLALHVRGSTLVAKGPAQVIDRLGLIETGWAWADAARSIELIGFERRTMATDMRVHALLADGTRVAYEARIAVERFVPQITCGTIARPEYDVEPVWKVEDWRRVDIDHG